jgi:hypothetical protein
MISGASPIRFYKAGATDFENGSLKLHTSTTYYQEFKGLAKTVVFANSEKTSNFVEWVRESELCDNVGYTISNIECSVNQEIRLEVFSTNILVKLIKDSIVLQSTPIDSLVYVPITFEILESGIYDIEIELLGSTQQVCSKNVAIYDLIVEPFFYKICGETYEATLLGETPYKDEDNNVLYAWELNTADHSTADGIYIIEYNDYISEPIYINNSTHFKPIAYKVNGWRNCAMKNYTYVLWLEYKLDVIPAGEDSISNQQNRNVIVDSFLEFNRKFSIKTIIPYYVAEILQQAVSYDTVLIENNPYTKVDNPSFDLIEENTWFHNWNINVRKPLKCKDYGQNEFVCADGIATLSDQDGNPLESFNVPSGQEIIIPISTGGIIEPIFLNVTDCEGNTTTTEIPQGSTININDFVCGGGGETYTYRVEYENGTLIQEGTVTENLIVQVPNPIQCDDATYNLDNTDGATLFLGSIPSGDNETIIAPDATFSINSTQVSTIPSGTSDSIQVRKQSGSDQIGSLQGQHWRIDNSAITLKDTANNTLSNTSVPATESADIIAPNGNIENTNETFIASVLSGGTLVLDDQNVEVNGQLEGAFVAMQTLEIETLDEDMNITSPILSFAPEILTIEVETLDTLTWAFLVVNWDNPPTFVATIAGYDIYLYTLNSVNRYRSVPEPYVNSLDAFWEDFDGTNLINLITNRL